MKLRIVVVLAALLAAPLFSAAQPAKADSCQFVLGFQTIHDMIPTIVGDCLVDEHHNGTNGDGLQETTGPVGGSGTGLLVWRKADNWTAYTDGYHTWINGPNGLQERLNTTCFSWEAGCAPTSLSALPVMIPVASTRIAAVFNGLRSTDTAIFITDNPIPLVVSAITQGQIAYAEQSWSAMQSALPTYPSQDTVAILDLESGQHTPQAEQSDVVGTTAAASAAVHATGRKLAIVPGVIFSQQYAAQLAPYADIYMIQAQRYQNNLTQFDNFVTQTTQQVKAANPNCAVWVQVQVTSQYGPAGATSPQGALAALQSLPNLPDGIVVFTFGPQDTATQNFMTLLRPNG